MTAMTRQEAATSTFGKADASRTAYCKDVVSTIDPNDTLFDFLDHDYLRALNSLPVLGAVKWERGASLTSLSMDYYGTDTHWQTILAYNGYIAASRIPPGAIVNLPNVTGLKAKLQASKRGTVTRI
jgi:hypothetical protein